jgi:hypothetical protein
MDTPGGLDGNGKKRYESVTSVKGYLVDTTGRILFYVPAIGVWEKLVAGMENEEVLKSRTGAVVINFFFGRFHGKVREWLSHLTRTGEDSSRLRKLAVDTASSTLVGLTSYSTVLYFSGASLDEAIVALPFGLLFTSSTGRPFGRFLDWYRRAWGATPVLDS